MTSYGEPKTFGFLVVPNFPLMAFTSAIEPLRAANRLSGQTLYDWTVYSTGTDPVLASSRVTVLPDSALDMEARPDLMFVCAGLNPERDTSKDVLSWLRHLARHGVPMGALSVGSHILARAGLLEGYRCTIHWEYAASFVEDFPDIHMTGGIFEIDRNRYTCSGGTAALDMMLNLIAQDHGGELAAAVSHQFQHDRIRTSADNQSQARHQSLRIKSGKLLAAIQLMETNLDEPITPADVATNVGLSIRQLERLFNQYLGCTPGRYYMELRLQNARHLLLQTTMPVLDVALASGFVSHSHFAKCYRSHFGYSPTDERRSAL